MNGQASQTPSGYPNPYGSSGPYATPGATAPTAAPTPAGTAYQPSTPPQPVVAKPARNGSPLLAILMLIIGLLVGGAAGYFLGDILVFSSERTQLTTERTQLQQRVAQLEQQVATLQAGTGNSGTGTGNTGTGTQTPGTGTAPTVSGVTPDPETATWSVYDNATFHISFRHPSDYTVREFQNSGDLTSQDLDPEEVAFAVGIFKASEAEPAGMVVVFKSQENDGPDHRGLTLFSFPGQLPTTLVTEAAGAGQINKVDEKTVIVNGTDAVELTAVEGRGSEATPGGSTYTGYLFEEQFNQNYLATYCDSDQTTQSNIVGCLWLTTVNITR